MPIDGMPIPVMRLGLCALLARVQVMLHHHVQCEVGYMSRHNKDAGVLMRYLRIGYHLHTEPETCCRTANVDETLTDHAGPIARVSFHPPLAKHPSPISNHQIHFQGGYTKKGYLQTPAPPLKNAKYRLLQRSIRRIASGTLVSSPPCKSHSLHVKRKAASVARIDVSSKWTRKGVV
jgi:hypothetical protein